MNIYMPTTLSCMNITYMNMYICIYITCSVYVEHVHAVYYVHVHDVYYVVGVPVLGIASWEFKRVHVKEN